MNESEQFVKDNWMDGNLIRKTKGCDFEIEGGGVVEVKTSSPTGVRERQMQDMANAHANGKPAYLVVVRGVSTFIFELKEVKNYYYKKETEYSHAIRITDASKKELDIMKDDGETYCEIIDRLIESDDSPEDIIIE